MLRGTFGQTALLVSVALLIAQGVGYFLLVNERDRWRLLDTAQTAVDGFVVAARDVERLPTGARPEGAIRASRPDQRFMITPTSAIVMLGLKHEDDLERRLVDALARAGIRARSAQASSVGFAQSPAGNARHPRFPLELLARPPQGLFPPGQAMPFPLPPPPQPAFGMNPPPFNDDQQIQEVDLSIQFLDGTWLNGRFLSHHPSSSFLTRLVLAEIVLFALVLTVTLVVAMRIARPVVQLATFADHVGPDRMPSAIPERGPGDIRAAIRSFNMMAKRVSDLLREKDQMLGAIGHDLRTPLASLRVRVEGVEPATERQKMINTLDDMKQMIDEILDLARLGHSGEAFTLVDLSALADAIVEEFRELCKEAHFGDSQRIVVRVQPLLVKRLIRNLLDNATKYGHRALVWVENMDGVISLNIADDGPGIPEDALERVFEPFSRLEVSRNRATGGIGIGLSIAQAIARNQGARLTLENRKDGGLLVRVVWRTDSVG